MDSKGSAVFSPAADTILNHVRATEVGRCPRNGYGRLEADESSGDGELEDEAAGLDSRMREKPARNAFSRS
jgi:hypothetical protein